MNRPSFAVSSDNHVVANTVSALFGRASEISAYEDQAGHSSIDLMSCDASPAPGLTSYSTLCLSDQQFKTTPDRLPLGVEIVGVAETHWSVFPFALASAAFFVINDQLECEPGAIFDKVLSINDDSLRMQHFMFCMPYLWENELSVLYLERKAVAWVLAVPISESERQFAHREGADSLEHELANANINLYDLNRHPVV